MSGVGLRRLRRLAVTAGLLVVAVLPSTGAGQERPDCGDVDLAPCDLHVTARGRALSANRVVITALVRNVGERESFEVPLTITADGWPTFITTIPGLQSGDGKRVIALLDVPSSAHGTRAVFRVEVAPHENEGTKGRNAVDVAIEIPESEAPPPPDLVADSAVARVVDDDRVEISGVVRNDGSATGESISVTVSAPGWDGETETLEGGIDQGGQREFAISLDVPDEQRGASVPFHVAVEPLEAEEVTDNNDTETNTVAIPAPEGPVEGPTPDLAVARAVARVIENGQRVEVSGSVENRGDLTNDELTLTVGSPGWDTESASLPDGLATGATRAYSLALDIPDQARGVDAVFRVELAPVEGEVELANNARDAVAVAVPLVEVADEGDGVPWALVVAGAAAALAAAAVAGRRLAARRRAAPPTAPQAEPPAGAPPSAPPSAGDEYASAGPPVGAAPPGTSGRDGGEAAPSGEPAAVRPERVVSTGFSSEWVPETPLSADTPLLPLTPYLFWLEVGPPVAGSIERAPTDLPADLPAEAVLTVAVFSLDDALSVEPDHDCGELRLERDGSVLVTGAAARGVGLARDPALDKRRLFFRVRTGAMPATARLRCNIYHQNVLVQARLITAEVRASPEYVAGALRSTVDYTLAPALDAVRLAGLEPHRLSVLVNESGDGSHDFYFLGEDEFKSQASFDGQELQNLIIRARASLKRAAWGDPGDWAEGKSYRYDDFDLQRLEVDLVRFALAGYRFYDAIINRLAGGRDSVQPLAELMLEPGLVQIASRESPRHIIPAALIYDYPLDSTGELGDYELCSAFVDAILEQASLADSACFRGECPNRAAKMVVCPSGFWGYRHALGLPISVATTAPDLPTEIVCTSGPQLIVAVSTDPAFVMRIEHETSLRGLRSELGWLYADTRERALSLLKAGGAEIVYFYCHGGVLEDVPFIQVGALNERGITRDLLRSEAIEWSSPRPIVFINGCHTTALEPEKAIEFVSALVETSGASGVIGTEITVFEPLASAFAEDCLRRFLAGEPIGAAVRGARLSLLARGNPLGLAYISFATASLKLRAAQES